MLTPHGTLPALVLGLAIMASAHDLEPIQGPQPPEPVLEPLTPIEKARIREVEQLRQAQAQLTARRRALRRALEDPKYPYREQHEADAEACELELGAIEERLKKLKPIVEVIQNRQREHAQLWTEWQLKKMGQKGRDPHKDYHDGVIPKPTPPGFREYHRDNLPDLEL